MKTIQFLFAASLTTLLLTSCTQDLIVDQDLSPESQTNTRDLPVQQVIQFVSWQDVAIDRPDCPITTKEYVEQNGDDKPAFEAGCMGPFGFEGQGTGYIEEFDRFYVKTSIKFDAVTHSFSGLLHFDFASSESVLMLKIEGPGQSSPSVENGLEIHVPVRYYGGSGIFEHIDFQGMLKIMHADDIFDAQNTEYQATLLVEGEVIAF